MNKGDVRRWLAVALVLAGAGIVRGDDRALLVGHGPAFRDTVRSAKNRVFPAVVFVKCIQDTYEEGKKRAQEVSGSGVLISPAGEALTNWHVIDKAVEVRCLLYDGRAMNARVVGSDKDTDLALLQLDVSAGAGDLPHAPLGGSANLEEGDFVMAMGAPWGLSRSVSIGIIACTRRYLPGNSEYSLWLQTDCAISPGNSGGPLVNTRGEVIGINSRGYLMGGDLAFAVPSDTVAFVVDQLRAHGEVRWSWTGLELQPLRDFNRNTYFEGTQGVIVASTDPESPARAAGLQPRDRILFVNDRATNALTEEDLPAVRTWLGLLPVDQPVQIRFKRDDTEQTCEMIPREKGKVEGDSYDCKRWDLTVKTINQFENPELYFHRQEGVFVYSVKYPGNAAGSGLQTNDIILKVDGRDVHTLDDLQQLHTTLVEKVDDRHRVVFTVLRNGLMRQVVLDFLRDYERE